MCGSCFFSAIPAFVVGVDELPAVVLDPFHDELVGVVGGFAAGGGAGVEGF